MKTKTLIGITVLGLLFCGCGQKTNDQKNQIEQQEALREMGNVPVNPFLIQGSVYPMVHWNSASSDVSDIATWEGNSKITKDQVQWIPIPPSNIGMAHYPYPNGEEAIFLSGSNRTSKFRVTDGTLELISVAKIDGLDIMDAYEEEIRQLVKEMNTTDESVFLPKLQDYNERHNTNLNTLAGGVYTFMDV